MKAFLLLYFVSMPILAMTPDPVLDKDLLKGFLQLDTVKSKIHEVGSLTSYNLPQTPWSSSYLPGIRGYAADPFAEGLTNPLDFDSNLRNYKRRRQKLAKNYQKLTAEDLYDLAPTEKYDLVTGLFLQDDSLTHRVWQKAADVKDVYTLTLWTGMCHGWSPASMTFAEPKQIVNVKSYDGRYMVPFSPHDIKSLLILSYANSWSAFASSEPSDWSRKIDSNGTPLNVMPMAFKKCIKRKARRDHTGRVIVTVENEGTSEERSTEGCEDLDPAFWHLAVINQLAIKEHSMVLDIDFDHVINNHPMSGYNLQYFNPKTGKEGSYQESVVDLDSFKEDFRKDFRTPQAKLLVGVEMNLSYANWVMFNKKTSRDFDVNRQKSRMYRYDLEISADGEIIGGEWRPSRKNVADPVLGIRPRQQMPDFLWYAPKGTRPISNYEFVASDADFLSLNTPMPQSWIEAARSAANVVGNDWFKKLPDGQYRKTPQPQVLFKLIEKIHQESH